MTDETIRIKRTLAGNKTWEVGKTYRVRHPDDRNVYDVKVVGLSDEFVEVEKLEQIIDLEHDRITVIGGTLKINSEYSEMGNCSRYFGHKVRVVHKIVDNTESMECKVEGKQYKICEDGCPVWKYNEGLNN